MSAVMNRDAPIDNRALVEATRAGDRSAREELGRTVGHSAYLFALQLTGDRDRAGDVAQDGVIKFFKNLDRFDAERPIEPWLYQIVRNRVRDLARAERPGRSQSLDAMLEDRPGAERELGGHRSGANGPGSDPAVDAERAELQRRLWHCVSQLSEAHREIFVLRDFHGLSYREIAETLSIPQGTVMSRLHAARRQLRQLLASDGEANDGEANDERADR
jgi:RNA polymerase sigma-70 factor (ECF subfamily)